MVRCPNCGTKIQMQGGFSPQKEKMKKFGYARAGEVWTLEEDERLVGMLKSGSEWTEVCRELQRPLRAVLMRAEKLQVSRMPLEAPKMPQEAREVPEDIRPL